MARKSKYLIGTVVVLLLIGVFIGIAVARARAARRARLITLKDGRVLEFVGTRRGDTDFSLETTWHRFARNHIPDRFQNWLSDPLIGSCGQDTNDLTVYLTFKIPGENKNGGFPPAAQMIPPQLVVEVEDETGFRYPRSDSSCITGPVAGVALIGLRLNVYPRRQSGFLLHLLDEKTGAELAACHITNARRRFPQWQPSTIPITLTNGPIRLTLRSVEVVRIGVDSQIRPHWRLEATDPAWEFADVDVESEFLDATGNEGCFLPTSEKAWMLRVWVRRSRDEDFRPDERLVLTNLIAPTSTNYVSIDRGVELDGIRVSILGLDGPGVSGTSKFSGLLVEPQVPPDVKRYLVVSGTNLVTADITALNAATTNELVTNPVDGPALLVTVNDPEISEDLRVTFLADDGRRLGLGFGYNRADVPGSFVERLTFDPGQSKLISIRVFINRPLKFEFLVDPKDVRMVKE